MKIKPVVALAQFILGCGAAPQQVDSAGRNHNSGNWANFEGDALEAVRASAEADIHCPREQINPWRVTNRSLLWYWYFAEGCAQRATYVQDCNSNTCRYVLIATVRLEAGGR